MEETGNEMNNNKNRQLLDLQVLASKILFFLLILSHFQNLCSYLAQAESILMKPNMKINLQKMKLC